MVGELGPGSCVGEGLLVGMETQPYKVTTTTRANVGWVSSTTIRGETCCMTTQEQSQLFCYKYAVNEVQKLIPADRALSVTVPSKVGAQRLRGGVSLTARE